MERIIHVDFIRHANGTTEAKIKIDKCTPEEVMEVAFQLIEKARDKNPVTTTLILLKKIAEMEEKRKKSEKKKHHECYCDECIAQNKQRWGATKNN